MYHFNPQCVQCDVNDTLLWQAENREEWLEHNNKMNRKPSKMAQRRKITQQRRKNGYYEKYYIDNPDKVKEHAQNHRDHDITDKEWNPCLKVFNYSCAYCGISQVEAKKKYKQKLHKDHVEHDGYNDLRNGVPACKDCNSYKWQFIMEEWFRKQPFFSEEKLEKIEWWITEGYKKYIEDKPPYRVTRSRIYDENNKYKMQFELWSVDEKRNLVECFYTGKNKKEIDKYIIDNLNKIKEN
jgi:Zn ribbon nucleic-acid-binding protein